MTRSSQRSVREYAKRRLKAARKFYENGAGSPAQDDQSERLTASGVMWRGPGTARRPADV
jgi:hypothetical protein